MRDERLDRAHMTSASAVMLPFYPIFCLGYPSTILLDPRAAHLPAFEGIAGALPMWTLTWYGVGVLMLAALALHTRMAYAFALGVLFAVMCVWFGVFAYAAANADGAWTTVWWPTLGATAAIASLRSVLRDRP